MPFLVVVFFVAAFCSFFNKKPMKFKPRFRPPNWCQRGSNGSQNGLPNHQKSLQNDTQNQSLKKTPKIHQIGDPRTLENWANSWEGLQKSLNPGMQNQYQKWLQNAYQNPPKIDENDTLETYQKRYLKLCSLLHRNAPHRVPKWLPKSIKNHQKVHLGGPVGPHCAPEGVQSPPRSLKMVSREQQMRFCHFPETTQFMLFQDPKQNNF